MNSSIKILFFIFCFFISFLAQANEMINELKNVNELYKSGALTNEEFTKSKEIIIKKYSEKNITSKNNNTPSNKKDSKEKIRLDKLKAEQEKIEEEKRQLANKREQERIKAEQIEEEKKRLELAKKEEERTKLERKELFKNILKYSLIFLGILIIAGLIYYINKFHKDKVKNLFLNLKNYFKNKFFFIKDFFNKNIKNISSVSELINKPSRTLNLKDFNIGKTTLFQMTSHNSFNIKFKENIFKEDFLNFLNKNSVIFNEFYTGDSKEFKINFKNSFRYKLEENYKYAEKITNLINKRFSSLVNFTNDETFHYKEWLSNELQKNGKITLTNRVIMWTVIPITGLLLWIKIYFTFISDTRFLTRYDYLYCSDWADPYNVLQKSNDRRDWETYDSRNDSCLKQMIEKRKP